MVYRYQHKLSGPLLDRFDLHVEVPRVPFDKLSGSEVAEATNLVQQRVNVARGRQRERFRKYNFLTNAEMDLKGLKEFGTLPSDAVELLRQAVNKFHLSARVYHRLIKVARTIADLAGEEAIALPHLAEALQYRPRTFQG